MTHADDYDSKRYSYEQAQRMEQRDIKLDRTIIKKLNKPINKPTNTVISNLYMLLKDK